MIPALRFLVRTKIFCSDTCVYNLNVSKRNAGHSKWQNIRHIKAAKDAQKSTTFNKMARLIRLAIQEGGGPDPNFNARLASVIEQSKRYNMPLASIKNALENAKESESKTALKSDYYEIRGPGGCTIIVSVLSSNMNKTKSYLNIVVRKANCSFIEGAMRGLFEHKGIIQTDPMNNTPLETAVDHAIEVGAEDVTEEDTEDGKVLQFTCDPALLNQVKGKLTKLGYNIKKADSEFLAKTQVSLTDEDLEAVQKLYDKLEEDPDVMKLHDNIL